MKADVVVLGGGPGGYSAAFRAADLGLETVVVEQRGRLGGVCLHEGCIPSKALLHVSRGIARAEEMEEWGVKYGAPEVDIDALRSRKNQCISALADGLHSMAKGRKVKVISARGVLESAGVLRFEGDDAPDEKLEFDRLILATGSAPVLPAPLKVNSDLLMTSKEALDLPEAPETLLVVGGAYVGLEMATTYARLGSRVTVVEMMDELMPGVDTDLVQPLRKALDSLLEEVLVSTKVEGVEEKNGKLAVTMASGDEKRTESYHRVLVAVGRRPRTDGMGLENTDVQIGDDGFVVVDERQRTSDERVLAVGDVAGQPLLAHKAFMEGHVAAEAAAGGNSAFQARAVAAVVFTDPEIAWVGLTEAQAKRGGRDAEVARFPWKASGRAHAIGRTDGLTKLIFDRETQRLLGAGIVGAEAGELISECALAIETGARARDLADTIHVHPTLGETIAYAAAGHLGVSTEMPRRKRRGQGGRE